MDKIDIFCRKVPSRLPKLLKKIKTEKDIILIETEIFELKNLLGDTLGDIVCFSISEPEWLLEKYNIHFRQRKNFLSQLVKVRQLLKEINEIEKKINYKKMYQKVLNILAKYDENIIKLKEFCKDRKFDDSNWNMDFDVFFEKNCPWNILLEEKRQNFFKEKYNIVLI